MDWGFHNPFAAIWGHLDGDDVLWITGGRYKSGTTLPVHSEALPKGVKWWCDPSGAESIKQLRDAGHDARACIHMPTRLASGETRAPKMSGIDMVTHRMLNGRLKIIRNEQTMPLIRELGLYHYDETKLSEEPVDEDNHAVDALRYLVVGIDRSRYLSSVVIEETDDEIKAREQAEKESETKRKQDEDLRRQGDYESDVWWQ